MPHKQTNNRSPAMAVALLAALLAPMLWPGVGSAKDFTVSKYANKRLTQAHKLLGEKEYADALKIATRMTTKRGMSEHELALAWQTVGYVYGEMEKYADAAEAFKQALTLDALPKQTSFDIEYNLGQIYMALSQYNNAITTLKNWLARTGKKLPTAHFLIANAYAQLKKPKSGLVHAKQAVALHKKAPESWLQMLASLYFESKDYRGMAATLKRLIIRKPSKRDYWLQLSSIYCEMNRQSRCLAVLQIAESKGLLASDREYTTLAQLFLANDLPFDAAATLKKARALKVLKESPKNITMLARSLMSARQMDEAMPPLRQAAKQAKKGDLYVELGQILISKERWAEAQQALNAALGKAEVANRGNVYLLLGVANHSAGKKSRARDAFREALKFKSAKRPAQGWLNAIRNADNY